MKQLIKDLNDKWNRLSDNSKFLLTFLFMMLGGALGMFILIAILSLVR